ncbi:MAG: ATP-dependent helicase [Sphingobacteriaceae bacterium]|nr:ATP-dependent helicase [Sphingobacteriaceae bacterium]
MVTRLSLENEVEQILHRISGGGNFLLSGGAGSGKTFSMVQLIQELFVRYPLTRIACVTYTNAAVKEIKSRVNNKNLWVSTIHEFLWANIKHFQIELRKSLIDLSNSKEETKINIKLEQESAKVEQNYFENIEIQYKEYTRLKDGIISHDELLIIANHMFKTYPMLCSIVKDKFSFIFVDEYQDTSPEVIEIFLQSFKRTSKKCIVGFFGDAMQSIYDGSIGNLEQYKGDSIDLVQEIIKQQNRRNPMSVIRIANCLRTDGIEQIPSYDEHAPNMFNNEIKAGTAIFLYATNEESLDKVREYLKNTYNWDFGNSRITKELNLTHNLIAEKAGFKELMEIHDGDKILDYVKIIKDYIRANPSDIISEENSFGQVIDLMSKGKPPTKSMQEFIKINKILFEEAKTYRWGEITKVYVDKNQLLDDIKDNEDDNTTGTNSKQSELMKHIRKIQKNIELYSTGNYNEFIRMTDYKITTINDKKDLKSKIEELVNVCDKTVNDVIELANEYKICVKDDKLDNYILKNKYVFDRVAKVKFTECQEWYKFIEGKTPFSTQHKTKGSEYDNVLVVLDAGVWNNYSFEYVFDAESQKQKLIDGKSKTRSKLDSFPRKLERSKKIFYVCCTRAKENLAVFYNNPTREVLKKAKEWFGEDNVINLDI